jgi:hypothetical protein
LRATGRIGLGKKMNHDENSRLQAPRISWREYSKAKLHYGATPRKLKPRTMTLAESALPNVGRVPMARTRAGLFFSGRRVHGFTTDDEVSHRNHGDRK